jgi:hypothetical protein
MQFEVFGARTDVEPCSVIHHQAANLAALANPICDNRNERNFPVRRDSLENLAIPNSDVGKIIIPGYAIPARNIDDAVIVKSHARSETGFAQRKGDVISAKKMFVDQRLKIHIR